MRDDAATRPSDRAVERLAGGVEGDLRVLRGTLHRALDEAERFAAEGRGDLAAAVVDEQRTILLAFHRRLEERVAEAAVEREAEFVVGATGPVADHPAAEGALRLVAAALAAVVGIGLLASSTPPPGDMTAAGSAEEGRGAGAVDPSVGGGPLPVAPGRTAPTPSDTADRPAGVHDTIAPDGGREPGPAATPEQPAVAADAPSPSPHEPAAGPFGLQVLPPGVADGLPAALPEPDRPALPPWTGGRGRAER